MPSPAAERLLQIARRRTAVMSEGRAGGWSDRPWLERSWRRCLEGGQRPEERVAFDLVPAQALRRVRDANQELLAAAQPILGRLARAIATTRYFAILTDSAGVVIDAQGPIDTSDPRANLITRTGVDLSERAVGTTAIGAALAELQPVWLHRGEHFFQDTGCYSCAGAPFFNPDGQCAGMLDLTGIDALERPELQHLVAQAARSIENSLTLARPHSLLVRLNWPGRALGGDDDALVAVDADGYVTGSNQAARQMVPQLAAGGASLHCSEWIAQPWEPLFDAAGRSAPQGTVELLLWSGLRVLALPLRAGTAPQHVPRTPLRDVEIAMIRRAVADARGNVTQAAQALGISRATVYRKLSKR